jgi:hypothetical protein
MAQTAITQPSRLTPSPKALQKALEHSAKQAQRLADAYAMAWWCRASKEKRPAVPVLRVKGWNSSRVASHE